MSLINDALKRAQDSAYQASQTTPPVVPEYPPDNATNGPGAKRIMLVMGGIAATILVSVIVLVVWLVPRIQHVKDGLAADKNPVTTEAKSAETIAPLAVTAVVPAKAPVVTSSAPAVATAASPVTATAPPPAPAPADSKASEDQIVAKVMERIKSEQAATPPPPRLVLQGITFAPDNRDAMINGVTVHEGDMIEGARVVVIESGRVTLDFHGQGIVLRLM